MNNMEISSKITKLTDLDNNDSLSGFDGHLAQQFHDVYQVFYNFLEDVKPVRILEIGTALGGFTYFLKKCIDELGLKTEILSYDIYARPFYEDLVKMGVDVRVENIFREGYKKVDSFVVDFIQGDGTTIVLCDGGDKKEEFNILAKYIKKGDFILAHDYAENSETFENKINKKIWNWHEIKNEDIAKVCEDYSISVYKKETFENVVWTCRVKDSEKVDVVDKSEIITENKVDSEITLVTGLWNIGRGNLTEGWSRSFEHYLNKFESLLKVKNNLIIFGDRELESFVFKHRNKSNTQFIYRELDWFRNNEFFEKIQTIRNNEDWYNMAYWLKESTQARLEMYNPLVMSKMFLLNDAKILDSFDSKYMFWIDAGLSNTVHPGYFTHDKVLDILPKYISKFSFVCFPYEADKEIHGFEFKKINSIAGVKVNKVARGGFFGGPKETISEISALYYGLLKQTLTEGYMGTEESIFSIICYKHSDLVNYFEIENNGLLSKFFEDLKNDRLVVKSESSVSSNVVLDMNKTSLYVIGFNSPKQLQTLIDSMYQYDEDFISKPKKYLLNNSTDSSTLPAYTEICDKYNFEQIIPEGGNLGICGGRQYIAEHFGNSEQDFMMFFEDDMFFYNGESQVCKNGFNRYVSNLYVKVLEITKKQNFDFLKMNYTEFFGDNGTQWSWYNVPQHIREKFWPNKTQLPEHGLDPNAPRTKFEHVYVHKGIPYVEGEIYYCNWPQVVTKIGNKKMFLDTVWAHPYEQTWMSHMYQLTKEGVLKGGLLLLTPTEHDRFEHYEKGLRKES